MNKRLRLVLRDNGRFESDPIVSTDPDSVFTNTISISRDFTDSRILNDVREPIYQVQGSHAHEDIINALKNAMLSNQSDAYPLFPANNHQIDSRGITATNISDETLDFDNIPTSGQFKLVFDEGTTGFIDYNSTAAQVQAIIRSLSGLELVEVTGDVPNHMDIYMIGPITPTDPTVSNNSLQIDNQKLVSFSNVPTVGNFRLSYNSNETANMAYNSTAAQVQTALRLVTGLSACTVSGNFTDGFLITLVQVASPFAIIEGTVNTLLHTATPTVISVNDTVVAQEDTTITVND